MNTQRKILVNKNDKHDKMNESIYSRNHTNAYMPMHFDPRPTRTRQVLFPTLDTHKQSFEKILVNHDHHYHNHNPNSKTFSSNKQRIVDANNKDIVYHSGHTMHYGGYAENIDEEHRLKNLFFTNTKYGTKDKFIPDSSSGLYNNHVLYHNTPASSKNPYLNSQFHFGQFNPKQEGIATLPFMNATRQQTRNI